MMMGGISDPSAVQVCGFLGSLFFLMAGWNQVQKFMDHNKDKPAPGDVQRDSAERYATKRDLEKHLDRYHADQTTIDRRIDGLDRTLKKHIDEKVAELHRSAEAGRERLKDNIDEVGMKVAGLEESAKSQTAWLGRIDSKIDQAARDRALTS